MPLLRPLIAEQRLMKLPSKSGNNVNSQNALRSEQIDVSWKENVRRIARGN
jgi:hypothetical protein